jgi:hypothetical protein
MWVAFERTARDDAFDSETRAFSLLQNAGASRHV